MANRLPRHGLLPGGVAEQCGALHCGQGHYVPQLAQMILDGNKPGAQQLNLKGFLLGAPAACHLSIVAASVVAPCSRSMVCVMGCFAFVSAGHSHCTWCECLCCHCLAAPC